MTVVRSCTETDLLDLLAGWRTVDDVHTSHYDQQRNGSATYLVAWDGADPLGTGLVQWNGPLGENARAAFPDCVEINHLHVRSGVRGHGVGTKLIHAAEELAREHGRRNIAVGVGVVPDNTRARRLYERLGYQPTGVTDVTAYTWTDDEGRIHHEVETDELLVKRL